MAESLKILTINDNNGKMKAKTKMELAQDIYKKKYLE